MSNYRDDTQETAIAHDEIWLRLTSIVEDSGKAASILLFALWVAHAETAAATDQVVESTRHRLHEQIQASDHVIDHLLARNTVAEQTRLSERFSERLAVLHAETLHIDDGLTDRTRHLIADLASMRDEVTGQRYAVSQLYEVARARDYAGQFAQQTIDERAGASDVSTAILHARIELTDTVAVSELLRDTRLAIALCLVEEARCTDQIVGSLYATGVSTEVALASDCVPVDLLTGQAWTANADSWAMSRYAPFAFDGVAVINGTLYATGEDGVYAFGHAKESIGAQLITGKLDLGQGALVHPVSAYLEYQLEGTATMEVTSTQKGIEQTYAYPLQTETANELTNGRFIFGRGLRGRHFSFALRLTAEQGYLNDLNILIAPTNRSV
jgi:hypothetical protein